MRSGSNVTPIRPAAGYLYPTQQAAHDDLMRVAASVVREIVADGGKPPPVNKMVKDVDRLFNQVWRHLAPSGR